jgi:hypothetical protein
MLSSETGTDQTRSRYFNEDFLIKSLKKELLLYKESYQIRCYSNLSKNARKGTIEKLDGRKTKIILT